MDEIEKIIKAVIDAVTALTSASEATQEDFALVGPGKG